jgi:nucleoside-diphosphate-sugar epimerase
MAEYLTVGITGSNGFLGRNLAKSLKLKGFTVLEFTTKPMNKTQIHTDFSDVNSMTENFRKIDLLIHAAWTPSSRADRQNLELQNLNIVIGKNVANASTDANVRRIIGVGSQDELETSSKPWQDNEPFAPQSFYSEAKLATHEYFANSTSEFLWVRLFSIYGATDPRDWILMSALKAIKNNQVLDVGACNQLFSLTHVQDAANAFYLLIKNNISGTANVSTLETTTLKSSIELLERIAGHRSLIRFGPQMDLRNQIRSVGVLEELGWTPQIRKEQGFRDLLENY